MSTNQQDLMVLAYVVKGFWEYITVNEISVGEFNGDNSEMDVMSALIAFAKLDDAFYEEVDPNGEGEHGLVWPYDISEPFGMEIAMHCHTHSEYPTDEEARELLRVIFKNATA